MASEFATPISLVTLSSHHDCKAESCPGSIVDILRFYDMYNNSKYSYVHTYVNMHYRI